MPVITHPRPSRPASPPAHRTRPRSVRAVRVVPSDGLTVDTPLGPVDLVAVKRALAGDDRIRLTGAEHAWIANRQRPGVRRDAPEALGTGYTGLLRSLARHRRHLDRGAATAPAACSF